MALHGYDIENKLIDHKDHNGLNNKKENIRLCSHSTNQQNARKTGKQTSSKFKGVYFHSKRMKYHAKIRLNRKVFFIGSFDNEIEAALAYNQKAIEMFGNFVCLNVI
jgi:hypothetical protein